MPLCGYCPDTNDSRYDALKHLALVHNLVVKTIDLPQHTRLTGEPLLPGNVPFKASSSESTRHA